MRGSRPHNPSSDYIIIDGIWFYKEKKGKYYMGNVKDENGKRHPVRAHVYVWKKHYGDIPKGYVVHHKDHDPRNNDISNLELMPLTAHSSMHSLEHIDNSRENLLNAAIPAAATWHKSEEGNEWHKEQYEKYAREKWNQKIILICQQCGKEYETVHAKASRSRFCSNNCKSAFRRASAVDNETRMCAVCGKEYACNKYSRQKVCGNNDCIQAIRVPKIRGHHHQK